MKREPSPKLRVRCRALSAAAMSVVALPLLAFCHEALFVFGAGILRALFQTLTFKDAVARVVTDPVHARILLEVAGGIKPLGLAVAGAPGHVLQIMLPAWFLGPDQVAPGAWVSAVVSRDSTIFSLILTRSLVECSLLMLGTFLVLWGVRDRDFVSWIQNGSARHLAAATVGLSVVGQAIWALFGPTHAISEASLADAGLGFALSTLWRVNATEYDWLMQHLLPRLIPGLFAATGLFTGWLLAILHFRFESHYRSELVVRAPHRSMILTRVILVPAVLLSTALASMSGAYMGLANTVQVDTGLPQSSAVGAAVSPNPADQPQTTAPITELSPETPTLSGVDGPDQPPASGNQSIPTPMLTPVSSIPCASHSGTFARDAKSYATSIQPEPGLRLLMNGRTTTLIGVNYNVNYTILPIGIRRARHARDLRMLRDAGVNAVIGWGVYDEATLDEAQEYGIGVIMPFDLDPQGAFDNAGYREDMKRKFRDYVNRFRTFPSLLAWNPGGDELLHRMEVDQHRTKDKLQSAADFLVDLSQLAYSVDPNHVSIVKDARDWYLPYVEQSIRKKRMESNQPDPGRYLVYGVNVYGTPANVAAALSDARKYLQERLRLAMLVTEYAPFGLDRRERPADFGLIWDIVLSHSPNGGFAYVFGPDQPNPEAPNPYDPLRLLVNEFSLVNVDAMPIDGSLNVLSARWLCRTPPHFP